MIAPFDSGQQPLALFGTCFAKKVSGIAHQRQASSQLDIAGSIWFSRLGIRRCPNCEIGAANRVLLSAIIRLKGCFRLDRMLLFAPAANHQLRILPMFVTVVNIRHQTFGRESRSAGSSRELYVRPALNFAPAANDRNVGCDRSISTH